MSQQDRAFSKAVEESKAFKDLLREVYNLRICIGLAPHMPKPDPPVNFTPKEREIHRRGILDRRKRSLLLGDRRGADRRRGNKDLWVRTVGPSQIIPKLGPGEVGYWNPGLYMVYNGHLLKPEDRARPNRRKFGGERRKQTRRGSDE